MARKLMEKQQRFLEMYLGLAKGNATEAVRMAGYAGNRVRLAQIGSKTRWTPHSKNVTKPHISSRVYVGRSLVILGK